MDTNPFTDNTERQNTQFSELREILSEAKQKSKYYAKTLSHINPEDIQGYRDLETLPLLRKSEFIQLQKNNPPLGGLNTVNVNQFVRLYTSPGPINEPETAEPDYWRVVDTLTAAGITSKDRAINCFSYHLTPAGFMFQRGCEDIGCPVFPGGIGNSEQQAQAIETYQITFYAGTPDFLKVIIETAKNAGVSVSSLKTAIVSGGYLSPELTDFYGSHGIAVYQCFGIADVGILAYESQPGKGMIVSEGFIVEILDPITGKQTLTEKGDLVLTKLNRNYPLIRMMVGDLSKTLSGQSDCGRTNMRIAGWLGRSDDAVKVKGMFVRPGQIKLLAGEFPTVTGMNLHVDREGEMDNMTLSVSGAEVDTGKIAGRLQAITGLKGLIKQVNPDEINADKIIIDHRKIS